jgi:hypothetical protein
LSKCDLKKHPRACAITQQKYRRPECKDCEAGENAAKAATPDPRGNETIRTKKEEVKEVGTEGEDKAAKERVLSRILREKVCNRGRLLVYCGVSSAELDAVTRGLEKEGKIKSWPNGRSCFYTPPDGTDPWEGKKKAAPIKSDGDPRPAAPRKPQAKPLSATGKDGAGNKKKKPVPYAAVLVDLEAKRQNIDNAIAALKALG